MLAQRCVYLAFSAEARILPSLEVLDPNGDVTACSAMAGNGLGITVGRFYPVQSNDSRACLGNGGVRYDLNDADLVNPDGTLDASQIVGTGLNKGVEHAFVLTPR